MTKEIKIIKSQKLVKVEFKLAHFPTVSQLSSIREEYKSIRQKVLSTNPDMKVRYYINMEEELDKNFYKKIILLTITSLNSIDRKRLCSKKVNFDYKSKSLSFRIDEIYLPVLKPVKKYIREIFSTLGAEISVNWINEPDTDLREEIKENGNKQQEIMNKHSREVARHAAAPRNHTLDMEPTKISEIKNLKNNDKLCFFGKIERLEERKHVRVTLEDDTDSITVQTFKPEHKLLFKKFKKGSPVKIYGSLKKNVSKEELFVWFSGIQEAKITDVFEEIKDNHPTKRFELHAHTKMSHLDAVASVADYYEKLKAWGHKGMAITDHDAVQAFPEAAIIQQKDKDFKFIFGAEFTSLESTLKELPLMECKLDEATFIVYDVETTGLYSSVDEILELSMMKIDQNGIKIGEPLNIFIKPSQEVSELTLKFTGIEKSDLNNGLSPKKAAELIDKFIFSSTNPVLVAHNATFDNNFLKMFLLKQLNKNIVVPTIDTLSLARELLEEQKFFSLGKVASAFKISYKSSDAHRADYDTDVLSRIFVELLKLIQEKGENIKSICEKASNNILSWDTRHVIVLAKNIEGRKRLYELVSACRTKYLSRGPRLPFYEVEKDRKNILVGSACSSGFVFQAAIQGKLESMSRWISQMDFIEIQPPKAYEHLTNESNFTMEGIENIIRMIVIEAKKQKKIIVATSDSHYLSNRDKELRDIFINTKGLKGVRHPFYRTLKTKIDPTALVKGPRQVYMSTEDMFTEFSFLTDIVDLEEIIVTNTNSIAKKCDNYPIQIDGVYPPKVTTVDVDEWVQSETYKKAHETYGEKIPEFVEARLKNELRLLKENNFNIIYYISAILVRAVESKKAIVGSRGSVGSSAVANFIGVTEVNPLEPHYACKKCSYFEKAPKTFSDVSYDLEDKDCPTCGTKLQKLGSEISFETFLGLDGNKTPDIDLNLPSELQLWSHDFIRETFGEDKTLRVGTTSTIQDKTAFAIVKGYNERLPKDEAHSKNKVSSLASKISGVKRTTGKHPGGILVIPNDMDINDFTPIQYPADNKNDYHTTHLDFHFLHDNILKFDLLGHFDPSALRLAGRMTGINPRDIPPDDKRIINLFNDCNVMGITKDMINNESTGSIALPEFGTKKTREIIREYKPKSFADLVRISGISHGEGIWKNNIDKLRKTDVPVGDLVTCRDDIMNYLRRHKVDAKNSFNIMENIRKGEGISEQQLEVLTRHDVPNFYVQMCKKISYLFPKAHAVAYVLMAYRSAYYKLYHPHEFYASFFTTKGKRFPVDESQYDMQNILKEYRSLDKDSWNLNDLDARKYTDMEVVLEARARGINFILPNINLAEPMGYKPLKEKNAIMLPFGALEGFKETASNRILDERKKQPFASSEDLKKRARINTKQMEVLKKYNLLEELDR